MPASPDILLVVASFVAIFSISSIVSALTARRRPVLALLSLALAAGLVAFVHVTAADGLRPRDIPDAFIAIAARVLN